MELDKSASVTCCASLWFESEINGLGNLAIYNLSEAAWCSKEEQASSQAHFLQFTQQF